MTARLGRASTGAAARGSSADLRTVSAVSPLDLDRRLAILARTRGHSPRFERAVAAYSRLGEHAACWLALGAAGALISGGSRRRQWQRGAVIVADAYALNFAVKVMVHRPRPQFDGLPSLTRTVSRLSFPSAHATTSFAAARAYRGLAPAPALYAAAAAFALSRPYLGVHYPSDVLFGAALGTVFAGCWPDAAGQERRR
jgi:undecaprenyl-diphosphatase